MQVIPAVDVLDGKVVRLQQGDYGTATEYDDDPVAAAMGFADMGAELVHVVDLDGARGRDQSHDLVAKLGTAKVPFQVGGGIRTVASARDALDAGAERVVVGSALLGSLTGAADLVEAVGGERVVAAIDVRNGRALGSGWLDEGMSVGDVVWRLADLGVERALVTDIEADGTMKGPAFELFAYVRELAPALSLIASGGVGSLDEIEALARSGIGFEAVIVGRALYERRFTLPEAIKAASEDS